MLSVQPFRIRRTVCLSHLQMGSHILSFMTHKNVGKFRKGRKREGFVEESIQTNDEGMWKPNHQWLTVSPSIVLQPQYISWSVLEELFSSEDFNHLPFLTSFLR